MINSLQTEINFSGLKETKSIQDYVLKKLSKVTNFIGSGSKVKVDIKSDSNRPAVRDDIRLDIKISHQKEFIEVKENGYNLYAMIDKATDILKERLKRVKEKSHKYH